MAVFSSRIEIDWRILTFFLLFSTQILAEGLLCYSCFSLNYRSQVAPRNNPPPEPQNRKNLSEIVSLLHRLSSAVPPLSDGCADVSLTSQPSFISTPRTICDGNFPLCAKISFTHKGEKVVVRDCFSRLKRRYVPSFESSQKGFCPEGICLDSLEMRRSALVEAICVIPQDIFSSFPRSFSGYFAHFEEDDLFEICNCLLNFREFFAFPTQKRHFQ